MTEEEKKSIELLKAQITLLKHGHNFETTDEYSRLSLKRIYEDVLNLIEKQGKIIVLMAEDLSYEYKQYEPCKLENAVSDCHAYTNCAECIIEHFRKEVENERNKI